MPLQPVSSTFDAKLALRRRFRRLRRAHVAATGAGELAVAERELAGRLASVLAGIGEIASYAAVGDEINPHMIGSGRDLLFPRVVGEALVFHRCPLARLARGFAGIPEPPADAPLAVPAVVLVPLVAATRGGVRLGQGAGHYDRTLAALRRAGPVVAIGLAHDVQIADTLPVDAWDQPLDWLATPTHLVDCAGNR